MTGVCAQCQRPLTGHADDTRVRGSEMVCVWCFQGIEGPAFSRAAAAVGAPATRTIQSISKPVPASTHISYLFFLAAVVLVGFGLWKMTAYDSEVDKIVGGDAFNYIILATRGTGWIGAGVASAVLACWCVLLGRKS